MVVKVTYWDCETDPYHPCEHDTKKEAEECYKEHIKYLNEKCDCCELKNKDCKSLLHKMPRISWDMIKDSNWNVKRPKCCQPFEVKINENVKK